MATAYQNYQPLDTAQRQIRLITIHATHAFGTAGAGNNSAILKCTLETVALKQANPFYALSYVWGPPTPIGPIQVNGELIQVRRQLWCFLHALRKRFCDDSKTTSPGAGTIRVWADYVCIAQNDLRERSSQVAMMGDLYKAADAIYAWLGESEAQDDDGGMKCVAQTIDLRKQRMSWMQIRRDVGDIETRMRDISTSTYWGRMWIKQEALLAKDVWFFQAHSVAHWQDVTFAARLCPAQPKDPSSRAMLSLLQARERGLVHYELRDLVGRFADAGCQDPRDRIYALLALVDPWISRQITVDYTKPVMQVFLETYPYWTNDGEKGSLTETSKSTTWTINGFAKAVHRFLPINELETLYQSKEARDSVTACGTFNATNISIVDSTCPVATISNGRLNVITSDCRAGNVNGGFVLWVSLRHYPERAGAPLRQCFIYANFIPESQSLAVSVGTRVLFLSSPHDTTGSRTELTLKGSGTEMREVSLRADGDDRLSRLYFLHPGLWWQGQLEDSIFAIETSRGRLQRNELSVICNAAAVLSLLRDYDHDQNAREQSLHRTANTVMATEDEQPALWLPYVFGIENKILRPCAICKSTGRSAAVAKTGRVEPKLFAGCHCRWLSPEELQHLV
jgi:hypothetical protein